MIKIARLLAAACVIVVAYASSADTESVSDKIGSFPDCKWRVPAWRTDGKRALFCPNRKGKLWQLSFNEEFSEQTLERARAGDAHAIGIIGAVYLEAHGFPVHDAKLGEALLRKASDAGDTAATRRLALRLRFSLLGGLPDDAGKIEAVRLWNIAARRGDAESMDELGRSPS